MEEKPEAAFNWPQALMLIFIGGAAYLTYQLAVDAGPALCVAFVLGYGWHLVEWRLRYGYWP